MPTRQGISNGCRHIHVYAYTCAYVDVRFVYDHSHTHTINMCIHIHVQALQGRLATTTEKGLPTLTHTRSGTCRKKEKDNERN